MSRYIVREHSGYKITLPIQSQPNAKPIHEVMVLDRDDCYRVVWSSEGTTLMRRRFSRGWSAGTIRRWWSRAPLDERRAHALGLAARLNAAAQGEDAQAREGTGS